MSELFYICLRVDCMHVFISEPPLLQCMFNTSICKGWITDTDGNYTNTWTYLPGDYGNYTSWDYIFFDFKYLTHCILRQKTLFSSPRHLLACSFASSLINSFIPLFHFSLVCCFHLQNIWTSARSYHHSFNRLILSHIFLHISSCIFMFSLFRTFLVYSVCFLYIYVYLLLHVSLCKF